MYTNTFLNTIISNILKLAINRWFIIQCYHQNAITLMFFVNNLLTKLKIHKEKY